MTVFCHHKAAMTNERRIIEVYVPDDVLRRVKELADQRGISRSMLMRIGLGLLDAATRAAEKGHYTGTTPHRENLESVMVLPL